jgi:predicted NBD/HSP70 family sugar kinase
MLSVGVDLGGHTISAALIEREGEAVRMVSRSTGRLPKAGSLIKWSMYCRMIGEVSQGRQISFVGIGIPAFWTKHGAR